MKCVKTESLNLPQDLRKSLIDRYYWKHPNMIKFIDLLRSENENTLRTLATFIHEGFQL